LGDQISRININFLTSLTTDNTCILTLNYVFVLVWTCSRVLRFATFVANLNTPKRVQNILSAKNNVREIKWFHVLFCWLYDLYTCIALPADSFSPTFRRMTLSYLLLVSKNLFFENYWLGLKKYVCLDINSRQPIQDLETRQMPRVYERVTSRIPNSYRWWTTM